MKYYVVLSLDTLYGGEYIQAVTTDPEKAKKIAEIHRDTYHAVQVKEYEELPEYEVAIYEYDPFDESVVFSKYADATASDRVLREDDDEDYYRIYVVAHNANEARIKGREVVRRL